MTITNGYTTRLDFLNYAAPESGDAALDDALIEQIITATSRYIDAATRRRFYASTETHYFDVPCSRDLWLSDDLLSVTTLTNGDGAVIPANSYRLRPYSLPPYYMLTLKPSADASWESDADGNTEGVIALAGSWGYSATAPDDIALACLMISRNVYRARFGDTAGSATVTGAGVVITPKDVPQMAAEILKSYARLV